MRKVLIANRGEIAVRVARACRDAGLASVAVYSDQDLDAQHVRAADEAYALHGATPAQTYLDIEKIIAIAARSGADAVHPGYGFLAENAAFARAVAGAGLTWIGPPPAAIEALGDKVRAREIAKRVGAPLAPGTDGPVSGPDEIVAFAREHGLPVAIKAAFGGGGRGLKVARTLDEIAGQYESAVREATAAFGNGECFAERYLDRPRHVETQCLADAHGNVVVVSTRDCSLQRRHQKLVEEAPAPFLSDAQVKQLYDASKSILREAGYVGAGTCEFLVATDGTISFLEVNTRLQVEHPVSEEVSGIDLVREMFRVADGEQLGYDDPELRGHSIEFRINAEDPARNFLPAPGTITEWNPPVRAGRPARRRVRRGPDGAAGVRLADRQADRDRGQPGAGPGARPARARRVHRRRHAHRPAVPPCRGGRPRVRRRPPRSAHPLDRDRDGGDVRAAAVRAGRRGGGARGDYRGGRREKARGGGAGGAFRGRRPAVAGPRQQNERVLRAAPLAGPAAGSAARRAATRWSPRCRARS